MTVHCQIRRFNSGAVGQVGCAAWTDKLYLPFSGKNYPNQKVSDIWWSTMKLTWATLKTRGYRRGPTCLKSIRQQPPIPVNSF